jgi:hypothetical protein
VSAAAVTTKRILICLDVAVRARNSPRYCSREMFDAFDHVSRLRAGRLPVPRRLLRVARPTGRTYDHFQAFKRAPMHRAYALARAANGSYSAVFVGNHPSAEAAEAAALTQCQDYASRRLYADPSSCRVYAVDNTILGTGTKIAPAAPGG